uniref:Uncharacterized protein n=1 Tax=Oryza barthii TaxID=65489 RepID=A0A0D3GZ28_9ORYZ
MAARGIKRKCPSPQPLLCTSPSLVSPIDAGKLGEVSADLESSQDSSKFNGLHFMTHHPLYNGYPHVPQAPPLRTWYDSPNSEAAMSAYREAIANQVYDG